MDRERIAWVVGTMSCVLLSLRLVGRVPVDEEDRAFAQLVAQVAHEVRANYVDELSPERLRAMQSGAIAGMLAPLDPHTIYVPLAGKQQFLQQINGNFPGIGVYLRPGEAPGETVVSTPVEGGPAFAAGIEAGDVFLRVNGEPVVGLSPDELRARVQGPPGTSVRVAMRRWDGSEREFLVERREVNVPTVTGFQREATGAWDYFLDRAAGIAYVRISQFNEETAEQFGAAVQRVVDAGGRGLVVDLRFNGGGRLSEAVEVADLLLDEGVIVRTKGRRRPETVDRAKPGDTIFRGPVAVLVNGETASASEILAGALADHRRAAIVGTRTFGKGTVQEVENWADEGALKITIARYYLPSGRSVDHSPDGKTWGVDPTVPVELGEAEARAVELQLAMPSIIPPKSHATTLPTRPADRQLDQALKTVAAMLMKGGA